MASLTIRNIDERLKRKLRIRAAPNGRSMEEEARVVLRQAVAGEEIVAESSASDDFDQRVRRILSHGRKLNEPFDLKKFSDDLSDASE